MFISGEKVQRAATRSSRCPPRRSGVDRLFRLGRKLYLNDIRSGNAMQAAGTETSANGLTSLTAATSAYDAATCRFFRGVWMLQYPGQ